MGGTHPHHPPGSSGPTKDPRGPQSSRPIGWTGIWRPRNTHSSSPLRLLTRRSAVSPSPSHLPWSLPFLCFLQSRIPQRLDLSTVLGPSVMSNSLRPHGPYPTRLLCPWGFSRQEYWSGLPCPPPGDLPNPGTEPRSSALHADSLPSEPPGKPMNTGMGSPSLLQGLFPTQELNQGLLHFRWILDQLSYQGSPDLSTAVH